MDLLGLAVRLLASSAMDLHSHTERMIKGECRLIPVLRGEVVPPSALKGLIYADFRKSFSRGFDAVIAALQREGDNLVLSEWQKLNELIKEVFDGSGSSSAVGGRKNHLLDNGDWIELKRRKSILNGNRSSYFRHLAEA